MQESAPLHYQLSAGLSEQYIAEDAEDAESSVGDSNTRLGWTGLALCPSQLWGSSQQHHAERLQVHSHLDVGDMAAKQAGGDHSSTAMTMTDCGDDFELFAEDADQLLHDANAFDAYPGGVEAALADWEAAVSSKADPVAPVPAAGAEVSSSSCCNYAPQQQHFVPTRLPPWRQQQLAGQWQQQQQQQQQQPLFQQQCMQQWQPAPYSLLAAHKQQQLQQWLQQLLSPPVLQPHAPGPWPVAAPAAITLDLHQQQQQQQGVVQPVIMQQSCPFAAFKGDVVGAVLAGLVPAPSCDSNDEWMGAMCPGLPHC